MGQANFMDEMDCGNFFDHIDDLIDFPADDVVETDSVTPADMFINEAKNSVNYEFSEDVWSAQCDSIPGSASDLSAELSVPYEDIVQLEWLSNFVEDSFSGGSLTMKKEDCSSLSNKNSSHHQFHTSSPISVLESSSSCSGEKTSPRSPEAVAPGRCGRARSKRPRPAAFTPRPAMQVISPLDCEGFAESRLIIKIPKPVVGLEQKKKKKMIKVTVPAPPPVKNDTSVDSSSPQQALRKCLHCEITKTPQWRAGPMGPKTLCNACGVRFKSGRLFPEYRPAASPTFVPALHSNSHKKVLEMRNNGGEKLPIAGLEELIPNNNSSIPVDFM